MLVAEEAHLADDVVALLVRETSLDLLEPELDARVGGLRERATIHSCELAFADVLAHACARVALEYRGRAAPSITVAYIVF